MKKWLAYTGMANVLATGALVSSYAVAQSIGQDAIKISKPQSQSSDHGAALSVAAAGDYALMGAPTMLWFWYDSGGAYLFENGNTTGRQFFTVTNSFSYDFQNFTVGSQGQVTPTTKTSCSFSTAHTWGARFGTEVAMSNKWVALAGPDLGKGNSHASPVSCAGTTGRVPTVLLYPANSNPLAENPYASSFQAINSPLKKDIRDMAVTDTDLVIVAGEGAHVYTFDEVSSEWEYNTTLLPNVTLGDDSYEGLAIKGNRMVLGSPNENKVYVFNKDNGNWSLSTDYLMTSNLEWGQAVDFEGDLIAVSGNSYLDMMKINTYSSGTSLSLVDWETIPTGYLAPKVGFARNHVAVYGLPDLPESDPSYSGTEPWRSVFPVVTQGANQGSLLAPHSFTFAEDNVTVKGNSFAVSGNTSVVGATDCYNDSYTYQIGCMLFDKFRKPFSKATIYDNAENDRVWINGGATDWRRGKQGYHSAQGGAANSASYYYVAEPYNQLVAVDAEDAAILKTQPVDIRNYDELEFSVFMNGSEGTLYVDILQLGVSNTEMTLTQSNLSNGAWTVITLDNLVNKIAPDNTTGSAIIQFRFVLDSGEERGDVRLDNLNLH